MMVSKELIKKWTPYIGFAAAASVMYWSFDWAIGAAVHSRRVGMVPDITGKSVQEALNLLSQSHLGLTKEGEQYDKRFPAGTIVRQNPAAGMMAREGRLVKIILSQGGETLFVPDLVNQPLRNAQAALQNAGLSMGEIDRRPSLRFPKDEVMSADPPAGATVGKNALINIIVSEGPPGSDVLLTPDFVGRNSSIAQKWATAHHVNLFSREEADLSRPPGEVLMQSPTGDSPIREGEALTIVTNNTAAAPTEGPHVRYDVPPGATDRDVRILVIDEAGEREVFRNAQAPGTKIDVPVTAKGRARVRIFVNGIMAEEQELR